MADGVCLSTAPSKPAAPPEAALTIPSGHELREGVLALEAPRPAFRRRARVGRARLAAGGRAGTHRWLPSSAEFRRAGTSARSAQASSAGGTRWSGRVRRSTRTASASWGSTGWGGGHRTTGPARGTAFPTISAYDKVNCLRALLRSPPGCPRCGAASVRRMAAWWRWRWPNDTRSRRDVSSYSVQRIRPAHPMWTAWRSVQRAIVRYAIGHGEGARGLVLARALAMATYRRAARVRGALHRATRPDGRRLPVSCRTVPDVARRELCRPLYRPEAFVCLSESIDLHRIEPERVEAAITMIGVEEEASSSRSRTSATCATGWPGPAG